MKNLDLVFGVAFKGRLALVVGVVLSPFACLPLHSQHVLYEFVGDSGVDEFGFAVAGVGDVNADGFADVIGGARWDDNVGSNSGSAKVYSGMDGSLLYFINGAAAGDEFGFSVAGGGDINADGCDDFLIGAPQANGNGADSGTAYVYSGRDGALLYEVHGNLPGDQLGWSVSGTGDVNADGFDDWITGAPYADSGVADSGYIQVHSGADGTVLYHLTGSAQDDHFGWCVSGAGDFDQDQVPDLAVGIPGHDSPFLNGGLAQVFSGFDGSLLHSFAGQHVGDQLGFALAGGFDASGDTVPDLLVGVPFEDTGGVDSGALYLYAGSSLIDQQFGDAAGDLLGWSVAFLDDLDGDLLAEYVGGAFLDDNNGSDSGSARVYSGQRGTTMYTFNGDFSPPVNWLGWSVANAGDVNQDGKCDLVVGIKRSDQFGRNTGSVRVYALWSFVLASVEPAVAGQMNDLSISGGQPLSTVEIFYGVQSLPSLYSGCPGISLDIATPSIAAVLAVDAVGQGTVSQFVPGAVQGRSFWVQAVNPPACVASNLRAVEFQ